MREALALQDPNTIAVTHAGEEEIFTDPNVELVAQEPADPLGVSLAYFPTAEGYYDYRNNRYIYQYKDHLGNVRLSYARNSTSGSIEVLDRNDYYAFGMNMYEQNSVYDAMGTPLNNKYNQKELQETGFYDYGKRQYMPDLGRWFGMDNYSEHYHSLSPYSYAANNPIKFIDVNGEYIYIKDRGKTYRYSSGTVQQQGDDGSWGTIDSSTELSDFGSCSKVSDGYGLDFKPLKIK